MGNLFNWACKPGKDFYSFSTKDEFVCVLNGFGSKPLSQLLFLTQCAVSCPTRDLHKRERCLWCHWSNMVTWPNIIIGLIFCHNFNVVMSIPTRLCMSAVQSREFSTQSSLAQKWQLSWGFEPKLNLSKPKFIFILYFIRSKSFGWTWTNMYILNIGANLKFLTSVL